MSDTLKNHERRDRQIWQTFHGKRDQRVMDEIDSPVNTPEVVHDPKQISLFSDAPTVRNSDNAHSHQAADSTKAGQNSARGYCRLSNTWRHDCGHGRIFARIFKVR